MVSIGWKHWLFLGIVTAVLAALIQIIAAILQESPEWSLLSNSLAGSVLTFLIIMTAVLLSMAYFRRTGGGNVLGVILLVVGLASLVLALYFDNSLVYFFFPKTVIAILPAYDSMGIAFAGYMLLLYNWGEERRKRKLAIQQKPMETAQSS